MSNAPGEPRPAHFPADYGVKVTAESMLVWRFVEERLEKARNYWVASIGPGGRPHVRPVDGVWVDGALCFGGSPETRWVRNLQADPRISVNLGSEEDAIILEGRAEFIDRPEHPLAPRVLAASKAKYPQYYADDAEAPFQPFWCLRPDRAYAWTLTGFAHNPTRWDFRR